MNRITQYNQKKIFILLSFFFFLNANAQSVTTFAGSIQGNTEGSGIAARFAYPGGLAVDAAGNFYVADTGNHRIRKITAAGVVSTLAGSTIGNTDGTGTAAQFNQPLGVAVDAAGNVFVADLFNHCIRKITAAGVVTTLAGSVQGFADGTGTAAQFDRPYGVAVDAAGNVFVGDSYNHRIRKITAAGVVSTLAGSTQGSVDGPGTAAQFYNPTRLAVDAPGNVFVADTNNHRIRKITAAGVVSTLAGSTQGFADGIGTAAQFNNPHGLVIDATGTVFVADRENHLIRKITAAGVVSTLAGSTQGFADGTGIVAQFFKPTDVALDAAGNVFVADTYNHRIRKITNVLSTVNYQLENYVSVYPNPATTIINIELEDITVAKVIIFDMNGRILQSENIIDNKSSINISNLSNGIYLMQIASDKGTVFKNIVKR